METKLRLLELTENKYLVVMSSVDDNKDNGLKDSILKDSILKDSILKDSILKDSILYDGNNQDVAKAIFNRRYRDMKYIILYSYSTYGVYTMIAIKES